MVLGLLLLACVGPDGTSDSSDSDNTVDSDDTAVEVDGVTVTATAKETVFRVTWETNEAADSSVECGTDGSFDHVVTGTDADGGTSHEVLLLLAEGQTWECHAVSTLSSGPWVSQSFSIVTPFAPASMPALTLSAQTSGDLTGLLLVANSFEGASWASIANRDGQRVWWEEGDPVELINEIWLTADGKSVAWNSMGNEARLHVESLDGSSHEIFELTDFHHGFVPLPDGGFAILRYAYVQAGDVSVRGDELVEIDANGEEQRVVWSVFDDFPIDPELFPPDAPEVDISHGNSVMYYPESDTYLMSFYQLNAIVAVNRTSGEREWTLGGTYDDFSYVGDPSEKFARQHSPRLVDGGVLIFNNRDVANSEADDRWSEAAEYHVDFDRKTWEKAWSYNADESIYVPVLGNADRLADGTTLVGFGSGGRAVQVNEDGDVLWQLDSDLGGPFGYVHLVDEIAGNSR